MLKKIFLKIIPKKFHFIIYKMGKIYLYFHNNEYVVPEKKKLAYVIIVIIYNIKKMYLCIHNSEYVIHEEKKLVYVIIQKVASSSMKRAFSKINLGNGPQWKYEDIVRNVWLNIPLKNQEDFFKFTFVRNPFDRIYSCYNDKICSWGKLPKRQKNKHPFNFYIFNYLNPTLSFKQFIKKISIVPDIFSNKHFRSQHCIIYRNLNPTLSFKTVRPDYIGKFEKLEEDFEPIRKKYKLAKLPLYNITQKEKNEWKKHYTKELADIVYKRYKKDFVLWYPTAYKELLEYIETRDRNCNGTIKEN